MSKEEEGDSDNGINITLGKIVAYPVGILVLLSGLGFFTQSIIGGTLITLAGLIALPNIRSRLRKSQGISINRWATIAIVFTLLLSGAYLGDPGGPRAGASVQDEPIDASPEDVIVSIEDLGAGWAVGEERDGYREFVQTENEHYVTIEIEEYESIQTAESEYQSTVDEVTEGGDFGTDEINYGNEGVIVKPVDQLNIMVFRSSNLVVTIRAQTDQFSLTRPQDIAENMADIIVENINNIQ